MRRLPRWLLFPAIVVVLALVSLPVASVGVVRQSLPQTFGRLTLAGLSGEVQVLRDEHGVPHLYAADAEDLFEAQGFVHAQDRFYEMDVRRHIGSGRLAELFGPGQVATDAYVRTLGWRRTAEAEVALQSPSTRRYLDAYAAGVNAYLRDRTPAELSLEYSLLGLQGLEYTPEPWTAVDSLVWLKAMAWQLASDLDSETSRALLTAQLGASRVADLYPEPLAGYEPIVTGGNVVGGAFDPDVSSGSRRTVDGLTRDRLQAAQPALAAVAELTDALPDVLAPDGAERGVGSNSFALAGSRTASGAALLANDPHLATSIPSTFAQVGLHCTTVTAACPFDVSGFSLAGVPGVVVGRNADIAWGLTTSYVDVQDLYLEEVRGDTVRRGSSFEPLELRTEEITVRGEAQPRTLRIRSSRNGPLLSDVSEQLKQLGARSGAEATTYAVALRWTGATPGRTLDALLGIDQATDFTTFRAAAALLAAPSQNLLYADARGNIGYQLPGSIPERSRGDGSVPSPGWDERFDWQGLLPFDELPWSYNPPSGVLVAANQAVVGRQYPHRLGSEFSYGWRSQQLLDRIQAAGPLTADAAEQLMYDDTVRVAEQLVPALLRVRVDDTWVAEGQQTLVGWDYRASADSAAAAYFAVVLRDVLRRTFDDELPPDLQPSGGDRWYAVLQQLLEQPDSSWWDDVETPALERRDDVLLAAMTQARKEATALMSREVTGWSWGRLHTVRLRNQTLGRSGIGVVEALFNRGRYPVGGGSAVVNAMAYDECRDDFDVTTAPTMRMLVDLGSPDASRWVNQSGVSGHAFTDSYDDQTPLWAAGRTWPFVHTRAAVEAATTDTLVLAPGG